MPTRKKSASFSWNSLVFKTWSFDELEILAKALMRFLFPELMLENVWAAQFTILNKGGLGFSVQDYFWLVVYCSIAYWLVSWEVHDEVEQFRAMDLGSVLGNGWEPLAEGAAEPEGAVQGLCRGCSLSSPPRQPQQGSGAPGAVPWLCCSAGPELGTRLAPAHAACTKGASEPFVVLVVSRISRRVGG